MKINLSCSGPGFSRADAVAETASIEVGMASAAKGVRAGDGPPTVRRTDTGVVSNAMGLTTRPVVSCLENKTTAAA